MALEPALIALGLGIGAGAPRDLTGFTETSRDLTVNFQAPVVRKGADGERELLLMRWGIPTPMRRPATCTSLQCC